MANEQTAWSGRGMARPVCIPTSSAPRHSGRAFGEVAIQVPTARFGQFCYQES